MGKLALGLMRIADMNADEVENLILKSVENGINFFDNADIYGNTKCESLFGVVLLRHPELRKKIIIQSKIGIKINEGYDLSYEYIIHAVKESIQRMNCGYLDILCLHRPDIFMDNEEVAKAVNELYKEGLIHEFGVSNFSRSEIEYLKDALDLPICYDQVALGIGNMTMVEQTFMTNVPAYKTSKEADDLFFYLKKEKIILQCWSPLQYGFFEGSILDEGRFPEINQVLNEYALKYHTNKSAIAIAFLFRLDPSIIVIIGSVNMNHILEAKEGLNISLSKKDWYDIYVRSGHFLP